MEFDYRILGKYLAGPLLPDEWEKLWAWREASAENRALFDELRSLRYTRDMAAYDRKERIDAALAKISARMEQPSRRKHLFRLFLKGAAVILLLVATGYGAWCYYHRPADLTIRVATNEHVKKIRLADSTRVWLKAGSVLTLPASFNSSDRRVALSGEAFFDVQKDPRHRFVVSAGRIEVEVHGTSFSVRTGVRNDTVETILLEGAVSLRNHDGRKVMDMLPGEKVTYAAHDNSYEVQTTDATVATSWRFNQYVFDHATLRDIAGKLSTRYHVNIHIESARLARKTFRCVINADESLTEILDQLCYLASATYRIEGDEVFIHEKK